MKEDMLGRSRAPNQPGSCIDPEATTYGSSSQALGLYPLPSDYIATNLTADTVALKRS